MARDRLLGAATDELAATGEIEVAAVARRAEVNVGLPYRYFATRTGLLIAVLEGSSTSRPLSATSLPAKRIRPTFPW
ncbi:TetR/AcrR family transcriptional regulator [Mycobacterium sp.]